MANLLTAMATVRDLFLLACWTGARISDLKRFPELVSQAWKANGGSCPSSRVVCAIKNQHTRRGAIVGCRSAHHQQVQRALATCYERTKDECHH